MVSVSPGGIALDAYDEDAEWEDEEVPTVPEQHKTPALTPISEPLAPIASSASLHRRGGDEML